MRFYLAAQYQQRSSIALVAEMLKKMGHEVQTRWLAGDHIGVSKEEREQYAREDLEDIAACTHFVQFNLPENFPAQSAGRHIEYGYALAQKKTCYLVGHNTSVFAALAQEHFQTMNRFLNYIQVRFYEPKETR